MKIRRNSVLWALVAMVLLPGCTTMQENSLYSMWQERAYGAYGMPVPTASTSPFMSAAMPYRPVLSNPLDTVSGALLNVSRTVSEQETQFISQYYSLQ
ncbi:hypothetical protein SAMN05660964_00326 [Thiothrix caldifontis]|uniref:Uncharacterized protein n=2 Tax=Thiothrix TaxID=1030 RepID=A0A1H3W7X9_9GAMM|nr:hypothetical protein SAMN05660964_00326 [Thiothrix caldifontis]